MLACAGLTVCLSLASRVRRKYADRTWQTQNSHGKFRKDPHKGHLTRTTHMDSKRSAAVGVFVLIGLLCVAYMTIRLGKMEVFSDEGFELRASFTNVSGLRVGADVEMAGVPVGRVAGITLVRTETQTSAVVTLRFDKDLQLPDDTIASVRTAGLIGDKYIDIAPGGSMDILQAGDTIVDTEPALDLGSLIGKYAFGGVK